MSNPFFAFVVLPSLMLTGGHAVPTAAQILTRCQASYDSVRTFEQDVKATSGRYGGDCHISYTKPGKLRVTGKTSFGGKFDLIVSGRSAQVFNAGAWTKSQSPEMGLATITGVSATSAMSVSAMFLHTKWGMILPASEGHYKVSLDQASGRPAYRLDSTVAGGRSYWIDRATYFLVKTHAKVLNTSIDVHFDPPRINQPIPASRYVR